MEQVPEENRRKMKRAHRSAPPLLYDRYPCSGIVVEFLERKTTGVEEIEDRLFDGLGKGQEPGSHHLDGGVATLHRRVLIRGDLELSQGLHQLLGSLLAVLTVPFDETTGLPFVAVGADFTVAISQFGRSQLCRWADPADWDRIEVVHCGIEPEKFADPKPLPKGARRVLAIGRLVEQKGQLALVIAEQG